MGINNAVYLDSNIQIGIKNNANLLDQIMIFLGKDKDKKIFPYSPAHLEDLATSSIIAGGNATAEQLMVDINNISRISGNQELLPLGGCLSDHVFEEIKKLGNIATIILPIIKANRCFDDGEVMMEMKQIIDEHPLLCFERVILGYDKNINKVNPTQSMVCSYIHATSNYSKKERLQETKSIRQELCFIRENNLISHIQENLFFILEILCEFYTNRLDRVTQWDGKQDIIKENDRISRTHDITHMIYASYCDFFITADRALSHKARELYGLLGIKTKVVLYSNGKFLLK